MTVNCRKIVGKQSDDSKLSENSRKTVGKLSENCRKTVGKLSGNCRETVGKLSGLTSRLFIMSWGVALHAQNMPRSVFVRLGFTLHNRYFLQVSNISCLQQRLEGKPWQKQLV